MKKQSRELEEEEEEEENRYYTVWIDVTRGEERERERAAF